MKYSEKTNEILVRWQQAKVQYDTLDLFFPDSLHPDEETAAMRKAVTIEYFAAKQALKGIEESELVPLVKQALPEPPDVNLKTRDGYALWCKVERDMIAAEQKLFDISLEVADLFPHLPKQIQ